jgi:hypothetical protein
MLLAQLLLLLVCLQPRSQAVCSLLWSVTAAAAAAAALRRSLVHTTTSNTSTTLVTLLVAQDITATDIQWS